jgi:hypothetical protein
MILNSVYLMKHFQRQQRVGNDPGKLTQIYHHQRSATVIIIFSPPSPHGAGDQTQDLTCARQVLQCWATPPALLLSSLTRQVMMIKPQVGAAEGLKDLAAFVY